MRTISTVIFLTALALALVFGAQTVSWSWGPGLVALACGLLLAIPGERPRTHRPLAVALLLAAGWMLFRCYGSDVVDGARADAILVLALVSVCWLVAGIRPGGLARTVLFDGLALTVVASAVMAFLQWRDPGFCWPYGSRPREQLSGFFGHYNYFSNYLLGTGGLLLGCATFGSLAKWRRAAYLAVVLLAFAMIPLSGSRGGVLGLGVGLLVFAGAGAIVLHRRKSRWAVIAAVMVPFGLIVGGAVGWKVVEGIQAQRKQQQGIANLADGASRLEWIQLALSTTGDHPLTGGGSRSYSWERNHHRDPEEFGWGVENEPFVHNEFLQSVTDYGVLGGGLIAIVLGIVVWRCLSGLVMGCGDREKERESDAAFTGVAVAGGAMLVQSNLSFVFHFLPLVMLFGVVIGLALQGRSGAPAGGIVKWPLGVGLALALLFFGVKGSRSLERLWPMLYSSHGARISIDTAIARFGEAEASWPGFEVAETFGEFLLGRAEADRIEEPEAVLGEAIAAYRRAVDRHPFSPRISVNLGNALSVAGDYGEAEDELDRTVEIQGFMEPVFRGRFYLAQAIHREWYARWMTERRAAEALHEFLRARDLVTESQSLHHPHFWKIECSGFQEDLNRSIEFLENARVVPEAPRD